MDDRRRRTHCRTRIVWFALIAWGGCAPPATELEQHTDPLHEPSAHCRNLAWCGEQGNVMGEACRTDPVIGPQCRDCTLEPDETLNPPDPDFRSPGCGDPQRLCSAWCAEQAQNLGDACRWIPRCRGCRANEDPPCSVAMTDAEWARELESDHPAPCAPRRTLLHLVVEYRTGRRTSDDFVREVVEPFASGAVDLPDTCDGIDIGLTLIPPVPTGSTCGNDLFGHVPPGSSRAAFRDLLNAPVPPSATTRRLAPIARALRSAHRMLTDVREPNDVIGIALVVAGDEQCEVDDRDGDGASDAAVGATWALARDGIRTAVLATGTRASVELEALARVGEFPPTASMAQSDPPTSLYTFEAIAGRELIPIRDTLMHLCGTLRTETCDGIDDDCDGETDEDRTRWSVDCRDICGMPIMETCVAPTIDGIHLPGGAWECPTVAARPDIGRPCTVGLGACARSGVIACPGYCDAGLLPDAREEICDFIDNDCDGQTDEFNLPCAALIPNDRYPFPVEGQGQVECHAPEKDARDADGDGRLDRRPVCVVGRYEFPELVDDPLHPRMNDPCDGVDNDRDGATDEDAHDPDSPERFCRTEDGTLGTLHCVPQCASPGGWEACIRSGLPAEVSCTECSDAQTRLSNCTLTSAHCTPGTGFSLYPNHPNWCTRMDTPPDGIRPTIGMIECLPDCYGRLVEHCVLPDETIWCDGNACASIDPAVQTCAPVPPILDECNGKDDDGDGEIDEDISRRSCSLPDGTFGQWFCWSDCDAHAELVCVEGCDRAACRRDLLHDDYRRLRTCTACDAAGTRYQCEPPAQRVLEFDPENPALRGTRFSCTASASIDRGLHAFECIEEYIQRMGGEGEPAVTGVEQGTMRCLPRCDGMFEATCVVSERERISCAGCANDPSGAWCGTNLGVSGR